MAVKKKSQQQMEEFIITKAVRNHIRLRLAVLGDLYLNEILPDVQQRLAQAQARGVDFNLDEAMAELPLMKEQ